MMPGRDRRGFLAHHEEANFRSLSRINRELIAKAEALDSPQRVVLDIDSTEIPASSHMA